ncbi:NifB/NifX family molybdenum-iron cluster-binding protein [Tepidibacter formicigenes]|jgi:predicted Fe-Mo cluster-binding NifX family protein|uniref:Predicted Fe-Mo cluster-binding protein, NifX family n=1 Tax=Tepidibacter formicigenes DSM 15518 TaxID=1123349 RepID=A0A1M6RZN7_9FIRM|nr:NifB/NifX family molybdenum-iron cluster-binding protein [Tepidibacter formicigenes]SHK37935.1 Predicted Fe-Mo cluster-binding protein, NifX family [Tepidibacter formicigenes DSM 15518]
MRICVTSTGNNENAKVDLRFGRCLYFAIYDTENNTFEFVENDGVKSTQGAGIAAAQQVVDKKVEAVISGSLGPNAKRILDAAGIKGYEIKGETVNDAVKFFMDNELSTIEKAGPSHLGMQK